MSTVVRRLVSSFSPLTPIFRESIDAIFGGLRGVIQYQVCVPFHVCTILSLKPYQWGQANLTTQTGTAISPGPLVNSTGVTPDQDESGVSPNDGYSILGTGHVSSITPL